MTQLEVSSHFSVVFAEAQMCLGPSSSIYPPCIGHMVSKHKNSMVLIFRKLCVKLVGGSLIEVDEVRELICIGLVMKRPPEWQ